MSACKNGYQLIVPFIKAAIRPITYHHVFFTAVSQAAITKGNRFIPWAGKQDGDGWCKLKSRQIPAGGSTHLPAGAVQGGEWEQVAIISDGQGGKPRFPIGSEVGRTL